MNIVSLVTRSALICSLRYAVFFAVKSVMFLPTVAKVRVFFCHNYKVSILPFIYHFFEYTLVLKLTRFLTNLATDVFPVQN